MNLTTQDNPYTTINLFSQNEIIEIRGIIASHCNNIQKGLNLTAENLHEYHLFSNDVWHKLFAKKSARVFNELEVNQILELDGSKKIKNLFPEYVISNTVLDTKTAYNRKEIYFRLVRPDKPDIGSPHCDYWFDLATGTNYGKGNTFKVWVPICQESGKNGLNFFPNAPDNVEFKIVEAAPDSGIFKPVINDTRDLGYEHLAQPRVGEALRFDDTKLHAGAANKGAFTRVSIEITLVKENVFREKQSILFT